MMYRWDFNPGYSHIGGFGFNISSFIFTILFWGLVIFAIVSLIRYIGQGREEKEDEPEKIKENKYLDIIKERYAKGEINKKEFEQMKKDLV